MSNLAVFRKKSLPNKAVAILTAIALATSMVTIDAFSNPVVGLAASSTAISNPNQNDVTSATAEEISAGESVSGSESTGHVVSNLSEGDVATVRFVVFNANVTVGGEQYVSSEFTVSAPVGKPLVFSVTAFDGCQFKADGIKAFANGTNVQLQENPGQPGEYTVPGSSVLDELNIEVSAEEIPAVCDSSIVLRSLDASNEYVADEVSVDAGSVEGQLEGDVDFTEQDSTGKMPAEDDSAYDEEKKPSSGQDADESIIGSTNEVPSVVPPRPLYPEEGDDAEGHGPEQDSTADFQEGKHPDNQGAQEGEGSSGGEEVEEGSSSDAATEENATDGVIEELPSLDDVYDDVIENLFPGENPGETDTVLNQRPDDQADSNATEGDSEGGEDVSEDIETSEEGAPEGAENGDEAQDEDEDVSSDALPMPAFVGYAQLDTVTVEVTAPEGALPEGTQVKAHLVAGSDIKNAVKERVESEGACLVDSFAVDVTLVDAEGNEVQPLKPVNVRFSNTNVNGEDFSVYHVSDDGSQIEDVDVIEASAEVQSFDVTHFSIYVVGGTSAVSSGTRGISIVDGDGNGSGSSEDDPYIVAPGSEITLCADYIEGSNKVEKSTHTHWGIRIGSGSWAKSHLENSKAEISDGKVSITMTETGGKGSSELSEAVVRIGDTLEKGTVVEVRYGHDEYDGHGSEYSSFWIKVGDANEEDVPKEDFFGYHLTLSGATWSNGGPDGFSPESESSKVGGPKYTSEQRYSCGDEITVTDKVPVLDGHQFVAWFGKQENGHEADFYFAGDKVTYPFKKDGKEQTYSLDAIWATIEAEPAKEVYDGEPHSVNKVYAVLEADALEGKYVDQIKKLAKKNEIDLTVTNIMYSTDGDSWESDSPEFTEAGTHDVFVRGDVKIKGVTVTIQTKTTVEISPRPVTVNGFGWSAPQAYTGNTYSCADYSVEEQNGDSGLLTDHVLTVDYSIFGTNRGDYEGTFNKESLSIVDANNVSVCGNYDVEYVPGKLTITEEGNSYAQFELGADDATWVNYPSELLVEGKRAVQTGEKPNQVISIEGQNGYYLIKGTFHEGDGVYIPTNIPERPGYKFVGWEAAGKTYQAGGTVSYPYGQNIIDNDVLTFHAIWETDASGNEGEENQKPNNPEVDDTDEPDKTDPEPDKPEIDPDVPTTDPDAPTTDPDGSEQPSTDPDNPSADPEDPSTEPDKPNTDPEGPSTEPDNPGVSPDAPDDSGTDGADDPGNDSPGADDSAGGNGPDAIGPADANPGVGNDQDADGQDGADLNASVPADAAPQRTVVPGVATPLDPAAGTVAAPTADAVQGAAEAVIPDDATPLAEESISDDATPLAARGAQQPDGQDGRADCWVHWYMLLGALVSAAYFIAVGVRRRKHAAYLRGFESRVLEGCQRGAHAAGEKTEE